MTVVSEQAPSDVLDGTPVPVDTGGSEPRRQRLLMLTHRLPYPPDRGDRIRSYNLLKLLSRHFDVGIACTSDEPVWLQHHQLLSTIAKRVAIQPTSRHFSKVKGISALACGQPVTPHYHYRVGLAGTILQWHEQEPFDAVLTFCTSMIRYSRLLIPRPGRDGEGAGTSSASAAGRLRHVLDLVDVDSVKWRNYAQHSWPPKRWVFGWESKRLARIEAGRYDHFDAVTVVSQAEAGAYREAVGEHPGLTVVGNGVDIKYFHPLPDSGSKTLVFVGVLNYKPNTQGITWFVKNVFGRLRQKEPDAKLLIVGRHPTPQVNDLGEQPGVEVVGSVPDVREYLREGTVVVAPLRIARGVQNKVLEAMASARVVVCSEGAAQGIEATDGEHLLVADSPEQWVKQITRAFSDSEARVRLAAAARHHVEEHYSWDESLRPMVDLLKRDAVSD